jgi:thioesterase domain-containing protein
VARLSIAFRKAGFAVEAVAPTRHPIHKMHSPDCTFPYRPTAPRESLGQAIEASRPQLIVPCDDRVVAHLHELHKVSARIFDRADPFSIAALIETSLGSPTSYVLLRSRRLLGRLSGLPDVHIPQTDPIESLRQLRDWAGKRGLPAVLKLDGSWGGRDVILIREGAAIAPAFLKMRFHRSALRRLKGALFSGDIEPLFAHRRALEAGVIVQSFVAGRLANCAIACWRGEVLASIAVEVVRSQAAFGMATVVRPVEGQAMIAAAQSIARHLQLSGLCGFDFVLDNDKKQANLIEINPRPTQINHLSHGAGADLLSPLRCALSGQTIEAGIAAKPFDEIALFPQEWRRDQFSPFLSSGFHDVPYEEPELLKFYGYKSAAGIPISDGVLTSEYGMGTPSQKLVPLMNSNKLSASDEAAPLSCKAVQLRAGDRTAPLFLFPGVDSDPDELRNLAGSFRNGRAVFGLRMDCLAKDGASIATVAEMASQAVKTIRAIQPTGPYHLVGYSFGGLVAFAVAQLLYEGKNEVGLLALMGTPISQRYWPLPTLLRSIAKRTMRHLGIIARLPPETAMPLLVQRAARLALLFGERLVLNFLLKQRAPSSAVRRRHLSGRIAMELYRPGFYPGTLTFLKSGHDQEFFCDFSRLWRRHAAVLETYTFPTDHLGLVSDPNVLSLVAERLDGCLSASLPVEGGRSCESLHH